MGNTEGTAQRLLRLPDVMSRVALSRPQIYKLVARGTFPPPIKLGSASAWLCGEIDAWIDARIAESRRPTAG